MSRSVAIVGAGQIGFQAVIAFYDEWKITLYARSRPEWLADYPCDFVPYVCGETPAPEAGLVVDTIAFDGCDIVRYKPDMVGRLTVISSASVYCDNDGRTLDEAKAGGFPEFAGPITEEQSTVAPGGETYSTRKVRMERQALESFGDRAAILRPCAIYGPYSRHPREWWFVKRMLDGRRHIPLLMDGQSQFHTTNAEDIARAAITLAEREIGGVYNVADDYCPRVRDIGQTLAEELYMAPEFVDAGNGGHVGRTPWSVAKPFIVSSEKLVSATGHPASTYYPLGQNVAAWLAELRPTEWRNAFPQLAAYPWDMFDYEAEDAFLAGK